MANNELINSIVDAITIQIHNGKPYVTELELSTTLNVSRTRLRECIQTLDTYGIINKRQKRGITLAQANHTNVREAYLIREQLEKIITFEVLERVTAEDCDKLEEIDRRMMEAFRANDFAALLRHDLEFHHSYVEISGLKVATRIVRNLHFLNYAYMAPLMTRIDHVPEEAISHQLIVDALRKREHGCHSVLKKHLQHSKKFLIRHCEESAPRDIII